MNWFYSKDGQQAGPVAFSEIERLYGAGELTADSLVWQQGTPNWVKLSTVLAAPAAPPLPVTAPLSPAAPIELAAPMTSATSVLPAAGTGGTTALPDYGDFLCWGFIALLVPCVGSLVYIVLVILQYMEYFAARKAVLEGRLAASEYSKIHPVLFVLGFLCCGGLLYPLFMNFRNKSGYFKPQPKAVLIAIIVVVLALCEGGVAGFIQHKMPQQSSESSDSDSDSR